MRIMRDDGMVFMCSVPAIRLSWIIELQHKESDDIRGAWMQ